MFKRVNDFSSIFFSIYLFYEYNECSLEATMLFCLKSPSEVYKTEREPVT